MNQGKRICILIIGTVIEVPVLGSILVNEYVAEGPYHCQRNG